MASRTRFVLGIVCASVSLASFAVALLGERQSGLVITPRQHDFGQVRQGDQLHFAGTIMNNTGESVRLLRMLTSCRCTVADEIAGRRLKPGGSLPVGVEWDVGASRGDVSTTILIEYDGVDASGGVTSYFTTARLAAFVKPDYYVDPERLIFHAAEGDSEVSLEFRSDVEPAVELVSVTSNHRAFSPALDNSVITVTFDAAVWRSVGLVVPELRLKTTSLAAPEFVVPIAVK